MPTWDAVDLPEKSKNFLTETEVERFLQAAKSGRHGIRDHAMMLLMYRHGLRETELCRLVVSALDLDTARIWVERLKGSLSTHHPLDGDELRAVRRYLRLRNSRLPWLFLTERVGPFTRQGVYYLVRCIGAPTWVRCILTCSAMPAATPWRTRDMTCAPFRITWATATPSTRRPIPGRRPSGSKIYGAEVQETVSESGNARRS